MSSYDSALAALQSVRLFEDGDHFAKLSALMVKACNLANAWKPEADPYVSQRQEDQDFLKRGVPSILKAVAKLQALADEHERCFDAVVWRAVRSAGITPDMMREAGYDHNGLAGGQGGRFMRGLLAALHDHIETEADPDTRRAVKGERTGGLQRHVYGPLRFPEFVDRSRMPDPKITGLQFELVFYLRRYTAGRHARPIMIDDTLPTFGRPHHEIVAAFTNAALNHFPVDNGEAFNKAMKANTGADGSPIRWWGWGAPEGHAAEDKVISFFLPHPDD